MLKTSLWALFYKGSRVRIEWKTSSPLTGKFVITLDVNDQLDSVATMEIKGTDTSRFLSWSEITDFRFVVGCVGYIIIDICPMHEARKMHQTRASCPRERVPGTVGRAWPAPHVSKLQSR